MRQLLGRTWEPWRQETGIFVALLFEPRDLWVGVYTTWEDCNYDCAAFSVYVCLVPMLPVKFTFVKPR